MANMKELAKAAGVSLATISRVFNESEKVKPETRKKVLSLAKAMNYRPNKMAAALRKGKSSSIGIVIPFIDREVFSSAVKSMEQVLSDAGYNVIICQSQESVEKEKQIIENLKQLKIDGVIISISKETKRVHELNSLRDQNIPVVLFDRSTQLETINSVIINNFNGAYQATSHLIEQGCQRLVHLAGREDVYIFNERKRGFEAALRDHDIPYTPDDIIPFDDGQSEGYDQLRKRLQTKDHPDGILAHGDIAALVASRIIKEIGLQVPQEVALVGFGDSNFCTYLDPSLSSVNQRNEDVGRLAATLLINELSDQQEAPAVVSQQMLAPILKIRKSSSRNTDQ